MNREENPDYTIVILSILKRLILFFRGRVKPLNNPLSNSIIYQSIVIIIVTIATISRMSTRASLFISAR